MSDNAEIRRTNLRGLGLDPNALMSRAGRSYSYWRDLLASGSQKSFGEKVARSIEQSLNLPPDWLDQVHDRSEAQAALSQVLPPSSASELPSGLSRRLADLDELRRQAVLRVLEAALDAVEVGGAGAPTPTANKLLQRPATVESADLPAMAKRTK